MDSFVKVRTASVLRLIVIVAVAPVRSMLLQPGLQVMLKTRKELASVSVTMTLVPSGIPLTKAQSPAATVTVCAAPLPGVTVKVKFVPALIPVPAALQSFRLPRFDSFVKVRTASVLRLIVIVAVPPLRSMLLSRGCR